MAPKSIKQGLQLKAQPQICEDAADQANKLKLMEGTNKKSILKAIQSLREDITEQSTDMMEAIIVFKSELLTHSKRIGETEDRVSQAEDDVNTLQQKAKKMEQKIEALTNKIQDLEDRGCRSNLRLVGMPEKPEGSDMCPFWRTGFPKHWLTALTQLPQSKGHIEWVRSPWNGHPRPGP